MHARAHIAFVILLVYTIESNDEIQTGINNNYNECSMLEEWVGVTNGTGQHNKIYNTSDTNLQYKYFASSSINVKFTICWIVRIDTLSGKEIDNILWPILITVRSRYLYSKIVETKIQISNRTIFRGGADNNKILVILKAKNYML